MNSLIISLWWVLPVVAVLLMYKFVLRVFFGMVIVPDNRIGLVVKKYALSGEKRLPDGRIIAIHGEAGMQAKALAPGYTGVCGHGNITSPWKRLPLLNRVSLAW